MDEKPIPLKPKEAPKVDAPAVPTKKDKVIAGTAKTTKKSEVRKFADVFLAEDVATVKNHLLNDVLVPAVKDAIHDLITNGIDILLYGEPRRTNKKSTASKLSYWSDPRDRDKNRRDEPAFNRRKTPLDYDDITFETKADAEAVLGAMDDAIEQYGTVSVGDLYEFSDISTSNYVVANRYGWTDIRSAYVTRTRDGWVIKLPRAVPING